MPKPEIVPGLAAVADRYDALLCDIWGVIHNGREAFPAACEALVRFQRERGPVVLISNAARLSPDVAAQLRALGVPGEAWSALVTSGDVTRVEVERRAPGPVWRIGSPRHETLYDGLGLTFAAGPEDAAFISCTGLFDEETETPEDYRDRLAVGARRGIELVCANPDIRVREGDRLVWCAGALAQVYRELGGRTVVAGKPCPPIYDRCLAEVRRLTRRAPGRARVLAIGDGVLTDAAGATAQGLDLLFVADGVDVARLAPTGRLEAAQLDAFLSEHKAQAAYALTALTW